MLTVEYALADVPTCQLQWELERREGFKAYHLGPERRFEITVDGVIVHEGQSACTLTINID